MTHLKMPHAATKTQHSQVSKKKKKKRMAAKAPKVGKKCWVVHILSLKRPTIRPNLSTGLTEW